MSVRGAVDPRPRIYCSPTSFVMTNDADEIIPRLWQGSAPYRGRAVADDGFSVLVLCAREFQPLKGEFFGVPHVIYCPLDDIEGSPASCFELAASKAERVAQLYLEGHQILVTCMAGLNRSGLVNAYVLHKVLGWGGDFCVEVIQQKRRPGLTWGSYTPEPLSNQSFTRQILTLTALETPDKKLALP